MSEGDTAHSIYWEVFIGLVRISAGLIYTICTSTCAHESGTRGALFMCYTLYMYITMAITTKLCMPITECGMGKGM